MFTNNYLLLASVYMFLNSEISLKHTPEEIKKALTTTKQLSGKEKSGWKKSLETNYGITDEKSLIARLNYYYDGNYQQVIYSLLFDLFLEEKENFLSLTDTQIRDFFSDERIQEKINAFVLFSQKAEEPQFITELYFDIKTAYFQNKSFFYEFFLENQALISLSKTLIGSGFNYIRKISIIKSSYKLSYIQDNQAQKLLTMVGIDVKHLFKNWQEYLASVLIGKIYRTDFDGMVGQYITATKEIAQGIYQVIESMKTTTVFSDIWSDTNCDELVAILQDKYQCTIEEDSEKTLSFKYKEDALPIDYVANYAQLVANKDSDGLVSINEKPNKKNISRYEPELKSFVNWKKVLFFLLLAGLTTYFFLDESRVLGWIMLVITLIDLWYLYVIGTPQKLYSKGTLAPGIVINLEPVEVVVLAPLLVSDQKRQRFGLKTAFLNPKEDSFSLGQEIVCVVSYGDYKNSYYREYTPRPLYYGFNDATVLEKARKVMEDSGIYPKNIWVLLPLIYEKHADYALQEMVTLDETFQAITPD